MCDGHFDCPMTETTAEGEDEEGCMMPTMGPPGGPGGPGGGYGPDS